MEYATAYDVGDRKRDSGINEDSVAVSVFEQGHRDGYRVRDRPVAGGQRSRRGSRNSTDSRRGPPSEDSGPHGAGAGATPRNRSAAVFALADGAGGHEAGDAASYLATTAVCEELADVAVRAARSDPTPFGVPVDDPLDRPSRADDLEAAVAAAIVTAHREVLAYARADDRRAHTTVVAGLAVGGRLHYGWVGDSRAYVVNERRAEISRLTRDHAVVADLADAGELDDVEARVHPRGNEVTRALGGSGDADPATATVEVDTNTVELYAGDVVLVTSDGLIDAQTDAPTLYDRYVDAGRDAEAADRVRDRVVTDEEIRDLVLAAGSLEGAATDLIGLANERGGKDNVSTLLLRDRSLPATPTKLPERAPGNGFVEDRETLVGDGD